MRLLNQTLVYCAEAEYGETPAIPDAKKIYVLGEQLGVNTDNATFQEGVAGYTRGATVKRVLVRGSIDGYLFQNYYHDLLKAALRGRVQTSGYGPFTHLIVPSTRDYSFVFERETHDIGKNLRYNGCRIGAAHFRFPTEGFVSVTFEVTGLKETETTTVLDAVVQEPSGEPFYDRETSLLVDGTNVDPFVSANMTIANQPEAGWFSTATRKASEIWQGRVRGGGIVSVYAEDFTRLGWAANTTLRDVRIRAQRGVNAVEIRIGQARVTGISRPFMEHGVYRQDIAIQGAGRGSGYPVTVAVTNNQSSL